MIPIPADKLASQIGCAVHVTGMRSGTFWILQGYETGVDGVLWATLKTMKSKIPLHVKADRLCYTAANAPQRP